MNINRIVSFVPLGNNATHNLGFNLRWLDLALITAFIGLNFLIPYFYERRMAKGIFGTDLYLIWIMGAFCWIHTARTGFIPLSKTGIILLIGCTYVLVRWLFFFPADANCRNFFFTLLSLMGITNYLRIVNESRYRHLVAGFVFFAYFFQVYMGFLQGIKGEWQSLAIKGWLYNSGFFANYVVAMVPLLFSGIINRNDRLPKLFRIVCIIGLSAAVVLLFNTLARAAFVGVTVGCIVIIMVSIRKGTHRRRTGGIALAALIFLILFAVPLLYNLKPASTQGRLTIYSVSAAIIRDHPLFGIGPNRFSAAYNNYQSAYFRENDISPETQVLATNTFEAFNLILQILVEYGAIGILIVVLTVYSIFKDIRYSGTIENRSWFWKGSLVGIVSLDFYVSTK